MNKILLADGDDAVRDTLRTVLVAEPFEVVCADSVLSALRQLSAFQPDLLLLDLSLPSPGDFAELIQKAQPAIPIVAITAISQQYGRASALRIDALMEKPLDLPVLLQAIHRYLGESAAPRLERIRQRDFKTARLGRPPQPVVPGSSQPA